MKIIYDIFIHTKMSTTFQVAKKPLEKVNIKNHGYEGKFMRSSGSLPQGQKYMTCSNGFVSAVCEAYNYHHKLVISPDDVWLAIATQFATHVEVNAEALRDKFVAHSDKKQLVVSQFGNLESADFDAFSENMATQIAENIKDPSVREWIIPNFTTTTPTTKVVGAMILMGAMKEYFSYKFCLCCGIPEVTLLGTPEDWEKVQERAKRLAEFDNKEEHMKSWLELLNPVLENLKESSKGNHNVDWWQRVCSYHGGGSGPSWLSGWITTFCPFNDEKKWILGIRSVEHYCQGTLSSVCNENKEGWPMVDTSDIPNGYVEMDLTIDDNGTEYKCTLTAGHMGYASLDKFTVAPVLKWILYEKPIVDTSVPVKPSPSNPFGDPEGELQGYAKVISDSSNTKRPLPHW